MVVQHTGFCPNSSNSLFSVIFFSTFQEVLVWHNIFLNSFSKLCPSFLPSLKFLAVPGEEHNCAKLPLWCWPQLFHSSGHSGEQKRLQLSYNFFCHVFVYIILLLVLSPIQTAMPPHKVLKQILWKCWVSAAVKFSISLGHEPYVQNIFRTIWGNLFLSLVQPLQHNQSWFESLHALKLSVPSWAAAEVAVVLSGGGGCGKHTQRAVHASCSWCVTRTQWPQPQLACGPAQPELDPKTKEVPMQRQWKDLVQTVHSPCTKKQHPALTLGGRMKEE